MTQVLETLEARAGHGRRLVFWHVDTGALWTELAVWVTEDNQMNRLISLHHPIELSHIDRGTVSVGQIETGLSKMPPRQQLKNGVLHGLSKITKGSHSPGRQNSCHQLQKVRKPLLRTGDLERRMLAEPRQSRIWSSLVRGMPPWWTSSEHVGW